MSQFRSVGLPLVIACCLGGGPAAGQVVRLPAVAPTEPSHAGRLVSHPDSAAELTQAPGESAAIESSSIPPDARPGVFQKLIFEASWLAPGDARRGFGTTDIELKAVLALPCPTRESPLLITPGFAVHELDAPAAEELPPRLFDAYCQFRWMHRLSPRLGIDLAVTPGAFGDFEQGADEVLRITGHGAAAWTWTPAATIILGAAYLDREDLGVLPLGGIVWTPGDDVRYELTFPRPRIARRISCLGPTRPGVEDWLYLAGELGGGTWAIRSADERDEVLNYRDFRLLLGIERKVLGGLDGRVELGYVFGRKIEYAGPKDDFEPADTALARAVLTY